MMIEVVENILQNGFTTNPMSTCWVKERNQARNILSNSLWSFHPEKKTAGWPVTIQCQRLWNCAGTRQCWWTCGSSRWCTGLRLHHPVCVLCHCVSGGDRGDILVTVVVARNRDMRTSTNWYLVNLGVADLMVLFVCMPVALLEFHSRDV